MTQKLISLFAEELDVEPGELNDDSSPETVESWDSLAAMNLVAAIEEAYSIRLTTTEIQKMRTIGVARAVLESKGVSFAT